MRSSEHFPQNLGRLLAPTLPLRPFPFGGPWGFRLCGSANHVAHGLPGSARASPPLRMSTLENRTRPCPCSNKARSNAPSRNTRALQRASCGLALLFTFFRRRRKKLAVLFRSAPLRVWLPSQGFSLARAREFVSSLNALGLLPTELFSSKASRRCFHSALPLLSFLPKPVGPRAGISAVSSAFEAAFLIAPEGLVRVGSAALLGFRAPFAFFPPRGCCEPFQASQPFPSQPFTSYLLAEAEARVLRDFPSRRTGISRYRAPTNPAFQTARPCRLFKVCSSR